MPGRKLSLQQKQTSELVFQRLKESAGFSLWIPVFPVVKGFELTQTPRLSKLIIVPAPDLEPIEIKRY
jgi:hypothetical protein